MVLKQKESKGEAGSDFIYSCLQNICTPPMSHSHPWRKEDPPTTAGAKQGAGFPTRSNVFNP